MFEIQVGKLFVSKKFNSLYDGRTNLNDEEYKAIGIKLIKDYSSFIRFMNEFNISLSHNESHMINPEPPAKIHKYGESILGELIWKYVDKCTEEYSTIEEEDVKFIKNNYSLIWNSVSSKYVDIVKNCVTNSELLKEDDRYLALDEMINAIDKVLIKNLGYYHVTDGVWCKYSTLGKMIWNMFMMYDCKFENIAYIVEHDKLYDSCMEKLGRNAIKLETYNQCNFYMSLTEVLCKEGVNNYNKWNEDNYENAKKYISDELYIDMVKSMDEMVISNLLHLVMLSCKNSRWEMIEFVEEYYSNLLNLTIKGYVEHNIELLNSSNKDKAILTFNNVENLSQYKPIIELEFENGNHESNTITDIYVVYGEGSCSKDISVLFDDITDCGHYNQMKDKIKTLIKHNGYNFEFKTSEEFNGEDFVEAKFNSHYAVSESSNIINVNFSSGLTVEKYWEQGDKKFFYVSCAIPYVNGDGDFKLVTQLYCMCNKNSDKYVILDNTRNFIGIDVDELNRKISIICDEYCANLCV